MIDLINLQKNKVNSNLSSKIFLFYGEPKTWKTTVAAQFPDALIAGFEVGYQFVDDVYAVPIPSWGDFKQLIRQLADPEVKAKYKTIVIDTVKLAYDSCMAFVGNAKDFEDPGELGYGKGWTAVKNEFNRNILKIAQMGYGLIFIAHATETQTTDPKTKEVSVKVKADIDNKPRELILGLADFILYTRKETDEEGNECVYSYSGLTTVECGSRARFFPKRMKFTYDNIVKGVEEAISKQAEIAGKSVNEYASNEKIDVYKPDEIDFEKLQSDVIKLVTDLNDSPSFTKIVSYIKENFGEIKISQTNRNHIEKLIAAKEFLMDIKQNG